MKITYLPHILQSSYLAGDSVLVQGVHGIGKSGIVEAWAKSNGWYCEVLFLSLMDESDLQGTQYIENGVSRYAEPPFIRRMKEANARGEQCVLFLDELNRSSKYVQNAAFELILNGRINDHHLPKLNGQKTLIVAAINPPDDIYQTTDMDVALIDRFTEVTVTIDVEGWLVWARKNDVHISIIDFITKFPDKLHSVNPLTGKGSTPRSLAMLGEHIKNFNTIPGFVHFDIIEGRLGTEVGVIFHNFLKNYIQIPDIEEIINFVNKVNQNGSITEQTIQIVADELYENFTEKLTPIVQNDIAKQLINKRIYKDVPRSVGMPALVFLYSLNLETRTSLLKALSQDDMEKYMAIVKIDFNKNIFRSSVSHTLKDNLFVQKEGIVF